jgi:hypothetical protein
MVMLESLAYLAQIVGVIAVVATLVYLSMQVKQGKDLLISEARQAQLNTDQNNIYQFIEHPQLVHAQSSKDPIDSEEKARLAFFIIASMRAREHEYFQYKAGVLDEVTWKTFQNVIVFVLGSQRARSIWSICAFSFDPGFVATVSELIESAPLVGFWKELEAIP